MFHCQFKDINHFAMHKIVYLTYWCNYQAEINPPEKSTLVKIRIFCVIKSNASQSNQIFLQAYYI